MIRRGLVLGAGGALGFAWTVGALAALEQAEGFDCRDVDVLIGTSAGSITASLLSCGVPVAAMVRHQQGIPAPGDPAVDYDYDDPDGARHAPPLPALSLGSPRLLVHAVRHPGTMPPFAALSGLLPRGRGSLAGVHRLVEAAAGAGWAPHPATWIVAMDYASGQRVPFGRDGSPPASLADAVTASCAVPGWFAPVEIGPSRYVDGGTCSTASLDLLAGSGLDEVFVLAPMASFAYDAPAGLTGKIERRVRRAVSKRLLREAEKVRSQGTRVTLLGPGPVDLTAMGSNLMDGRRRDAVLATSLVTSAAAFSPTGPGAETIIEVGTGRIGRPGELPPAEAAGLAG